MRTVILDTSVLIHDPNSLLKFEDSEIIISLVVLEELDKLKKSSGYEGYAARKVIRFIENLSIKNHGTSLKEGVPLGDLNSVLKVDIENFNITSSNDNKIIQLALKYTKQNKDVVFISKDINLRIKARALGVKAENYLEKDIDVFNLHKGFKERFVEKTVIDELFSKKVIPSPKFKNVYNNEFLILKSEENTSALCRYRNKKLYLLNKDVTAFSVSPKNKEQRFALDLLLDDNIKIVSLIGPAGTGKTFLALASALQKVLEENRYRKLLITKPVIPIQGQNLGYLPGDLYEKMEPWMKSYVDNLDILISNLDKYNYLLETGQVEIEALAYIRGRNLNDVFIIVDEAQNLTPNTIKTIVSRVGQGSKIVLMGDIEQIDTNYLDMFSNGLVHLVDSLKGLSPYGHITLRETLRSEVAEIASKYL